MARGDYGVAAQAFAGGVKADGIEGREARVGRALALLALQPKTGGNLAEARRWLEDVVADKAAGDDWGILGAVALGRYHQVHATVPDAGEAARILAEVLAARAGHAWADAAAPKLAILWLYGAADRAAFDGRIRELDTLLGRMETASARRDTRVVMVDAVLRRFTDHAAALPWLRAVLAEAEALRPALRSRLLFQGGETARAAGATAEAAGWYRRLAEEFPRDVRAEEARRRAAMISGHE